MNLRRIAVLARKEWREIVRDRLFLTLAFVVPSMLMLVFGYGLSLDVENIPFALVDQDRTPMSRDYAHHFIDSRYFDFKGEAPAVAVLEPLLADNKVRAALVIPEKFQERLLAGQPTEVQVLLDGTFPFRAKTAKGYMVALNAAANLALQVDYLVRTRGLSPAEARRRLQPLKLEVRYLYNQSLQSSWSLAPNLIMVVLMLTPPFLTAVGVVREKESGAIYNIYASTASRGEYLVGKLAPYVVISWLNAVVLWLWAVYLFGAPFKGSLGFFLPATAAYVVCTTGIGLLASVLVRTQAAAMVVTAILTLIPAVIYSGWLVPIASLSPTAQVTAHLLPAMYYGRIVLGAFLKGVGWETLWPEVAVLSGYSVVLFAVGYALFHKRPRA